MRFCCPCRCFLCSSLSGNTPFHGIIGGVTISRTRFLDELPSVEKMCSLEYYVTTTYYVKNWVTTSTVSVYAPGLAEGLLE